MNSYIQAANEFAQNSGQLRAYESTGNVVILAGPGSGKTKTITVKMAKILTEEVRSPRGVACVTYNTESARELKRRLSNLGIEASSRVFIGTIHSFCLQHLLIPYGALAGLEIPDPLSVADHNNSERIFEKCSLSIFPHERPRDVRTRFDRYRRTHLDRSATNWLEDDETAQLIEVYEQTLREEGMIDFDDMIIIGSSLLKGQEWVRRIIAAKFPVLIVDEYQDLGTALHEIVMELAFKANVRFIAVGDPDQSIYDFTGANPKLLLELAEMKGVETIRLSLNYRNGSAIVTTSIAILNEERNYESARSEVGFIQIISVPEGIHEQARKICNEIIPASLMNSEDRRIGDIAILYADWHDATIITRAVRDAGLRYIGGDKNLRYIKSPLTNWLEDCAAWCSGGWRDATPKLSALTYFWSSYDWRVSRIDVQHSLRKSLTEFLMAHRNAEIPLKEWLDDLNFIDFRETIQVIRARPGELESYDSLYEAVSDSERMGDMTIGDFSGLRGTSDHLNLSTLHSSKGLEFDTVIMMGLEQGKVPHFGATSERALKEQRRLFYVGLTRARFEIYLLYSGFYENAYGRIFRNGPSPFIAEVEEGLMSQ